MKWLESDSVKMLQVIASILGILGFFGGAIVGNEINGGRIAQVVGGFAGAASTVLFGLLVIWLIGKMKRPCPVCQGRGTNHQMNRTVLCLKCGGSGRILF